MPDLIEPASTTISNNEMFNLANQEKTALLANSSVQLGLYTNNVTANRNTKLSDLTEATFGGYSRQTISAWDGPYLDPTGNAYLLSPLQVFTCNGSGSNQCYGAFLASVNSGVQATATNVGNSGAYASAFVITNGGTLYETPPKVHLTGATGAGATAHAVLTGGVVTSIVLDNPGSAYTTYTVVIDPPMSLVAVDPFVQPVGMALATDALPFIQEISIPAITTQ
jgi:hypothetical protein